MEDGFKNEIEIANAYNGKTFPELTPFQQDFIFSLFGPTNDDDVIHAEQLNKMYKPDISITINNVTKYVSIKNGRSDCMHFEKIESLIKFLRKFDVSENTQKIILLFHYGDGTMDGSGAKRNNFDEMLIKLRRALPLANEELNKREIVEAALNRFVFQGFFDFEPKVDMVYFGDQFYGKYASRENIINFVLNKNYAHINTIHFGPMNIQPFLRDVHRVSKYPEKRDMVQVKWHYLLTDLDYINKYAEKNGWY